MENGIEYLRRTRQNFVQFDVQTPISISNSVIDFAYKGLPEKESMMIYKGWYPTIEISSRTEFERCKRVNNDSDYRVTDNNILFDTDDMDKIHGVVNAICNYIATGDYIEAIDGMISSLEPSKKLELKK